MAILPLFKKSPKQLALISLISFLFSCNKLIEIDAPQTSINENNVYKSDATAISAVTGVYATMSQFGDVAGFTGNTGVSVLLGLSADEFTLYNGVTDNRLNAYYKNALVSTSSQNYGSELWRLLYSYIFRCNAAIEGLVPSNSITPAIKQQLLGEVKFMRAFFYFYLVSLYQNVPLSKNTDPAINSTLAQ